MKKHTQLTLFFAIAICYTPLSVTSDNNNGPYGPDKIIPIVMQIVTNISLNIMSNMISKSANEYMNNMLNGSKAPSKYRVESISLSELNNDEYLQLRSRSIQKNINTALSGQKQNNNQKPHMHLDQTNEEDAVLFAQAQARASHSNYFRIRRNELEPQLDLKSLQTTISEISKKTPRGQTATVYIDFNKNELEKPVYSPQMAQAHNLYQGTVAQALTEIRKQNPQIQIITNTPAKKLGKTQGFTYGNLDDKHAPATLNGFRVINPKEKQSEPKDFIIMHPPVQTPEEISAYIGKQVQNQNKMNAKKLSWYQWIFAANSSHVAYKPVEKDHVHSYLHDMTSQISRQEINQHIHHAHAKKAEDQKSMSIMQSFAAFLTAKHNNTINQIDVMSEIADRKLAQNKNSHSPQKVFKPESQLDLPIAPSHTIECNRKNSQPLQSHQNVNLLKNSTETDFERKRKQLLKVKLDNLANMELQALEGKSYTNEEISHAREPLTDELVRMHMNNTLSKK
ncbi:hypothetical protein [Candidatus Chromulinivorax destructor]|uniref:Uncharacterized protein n=1 Tax=Candidatus Chromulinivorax destructor TaxID=2066483 RepID=A0A345ZCE4_9BACT|nr:hypothetical protein [Candidatus Chromulinivorax destructor]AXK60961.1 hypothetical protein C0J27_04475 [Candidatus Chromulinivorax destructor]